MHSLNSLQILESSGDSVGFKERGKYGGVAISRVGFGDGIFRASNHGMKVSGEEGMGGCLGEGGEGVEPNKPAYGDDHWKGVGEVRNAGWREVRQGLNSSGELEKIDGDELGSSDEFNGVEKLPEVNDEVGRAESMSITGVVEVGGDSNGKTISINLT